MAVNVLVVDDSDVIRSMILKTLRLADVTVTTAYEASNGREALAIIEDNWVDLVIADINMPVMNGIEMLKRIRASEDTADLPVIVVSTEAAAGKVAELAGCGVSAYVQKPFTPEKIRDVVDGFARDMRATPADHDVVGALQSILLEVLEQFVLVDASPAGRDLPDPDPADGDLLEAHMTFRGRERGSVTLVAPFGLCQEMAANALGVDIDDPRASDGAGDVLSEVLNMTCGLLVKSRESENPTGLTPPTCVGIERDSWECLAAAPSSVGFVVEGRPALLQCSLRPAR